MKRCKCIYEDYIEEKRLFPNAYRKRENITKRKFISQPEYSYDYFQLVEAKMDEAIENEQI